MNTSQLIKQLLTDKPNLRDSKSGIVREVWKIQSNTPMWILTGTMVMDMLSSGRLSNPEYIIRRWRRFQELYPNLRGKEWNKRQLMQRKAIDAINEVV